VKLKRGIIGDCLWADGKHVRVVIIEVKKNELTVVILEDINDKWQCGSIANVGHWQFGPECTLELDE